MEAPPLRAGARVCHGMWAGFGRVAGPQIHKVLRQLIWIARTPGVLSRRAAFILPAGDRFG